MNRPLLALLLIPFLTITRCQEHGEHGGHEGHGAEFLGLFEEEEEEVEKEELERLLEKFMHKGFSDKGEYCAVYRLNYDYYCRGIWTHKKLTTHSHHLPKIKEFCPTYKRHCVNTAPKPEKQRSHRRRSKHRKRLSRTRLERELRSMTYDEILDELAKIVPCTPECKESEYPHCTQECKCDYDYPTMQRFCNPPPLPLLLNVCRLWYYRCPKYEQYHYASQYIYSKAEKGKEI
ncbi:hypothetical protein OSTOST_17931, partial [Ostertagia ostertagi]